MLVEKNIADHFLAAYKELMQALNQGVEPENMEQYAKLREAIYFYRNNHPEVYENALVPHWLETIKKAVFGDFIYLKKYQKGYVLQEMTTGVFYQVKGLTTPLEESLPEFTIVRTAVIPFEGEWLCDGLLIHKTALSKEDARAARDAYAHAKKVKQVVG
ncbi:MAG TPA: hypothetical protein PLJ88_01285 [Agitococcus sp.]|nr:hypothetical protein [Agitococcus sp.]